MPGPLNRVPPSMYPFQPSDLSSEIEDVPRFAPASNQAEAERMRTCEDDPPEGDQRKTPSRGRRWTSSEGILVEAATTELARISPMKNRHIGRSSSFDTKINTNTPIRRLEKP